MYKTITTVQSLQTENQVNVSNQVNEKVDDKEVEKTQ